MNSFGNVVGMLQGGGGGIGAAYQEVNTVFMPTAGSPMPQLNTLATLFKDHRAGSLATVQGISAQLLANSTATSNELMNAATRNRRAAVGARTTLELKLTAGVLPGQHQFAAISTVPDAGVRQCATEGF